MRPPSANNNSSISKNCWLVITNRDVSLINQEATRANIVSFETTRQPNLSGYLHRKSPGGPPKEKTAQPEDAVVFIFQDMALLFEDRFYLILMTLDIWGQDPA